MGLSIVRRRREADNRHSDVDCGFGHGSAEFAVLVEDKYHGKGLGYKLLDLLVGSGNTRAWDGFTVR